MYSHHKETDNKICFRYSEKPKPNNKNPKQTKKIQKVQACEIKKEANISY